MLRNPASGLCADARTGINAVPGDLLELVDCAGANASRWVFSDVDGSVAQATHSGAYPVSVELLWCGVWALRMRCL